MSQTHWTHQEILSYCLHSGQVIISFCRKPNGYIYYSFQNLIWISSSIWRSCLHSTHQSKLTSTSQGAHVLSCLMTLVLSSYSSSGTHVSWLCSSLDKSYASHTLGLLLWGWGLLTAASSTLHSFLCKEWLMPVGSDVSQNHLFLK